MTFPTGNSIWSPRTTSIRSPVRRPIGEPDFLPRFPEVLRQRAARSPVSRQRTTTPKPDLHAFPARRRAPRSGRQPSGSRRVNRASATPAPRAASGRCEEACRPTARCRRSSGHRARIARASTKPRPNVSRWNCGATARPLDFRSTLPAMRLATISVAATSHRELQGQLRVAARAGNASPEAASDRWPPIVASSRARSLVEA